MCKIAQLLPQWFSNSVIWIQIWSTQVNIVSPTLSVTNESQARDNFCCKTKSEMTLSAIKWKDIVCCKTFSVKRHCQFWQFLLRHCWLRDIFCFYQKRHCPLWDIFSFQTLAVVRHFQLSDILHYETLSVTNLPISVSWVMEFPTYRYKTSLILSKKNVMAFKINTAFCELTLCGINPR